MSQPSQPSGRPGRYQRSFGGLLGAMIVLVVVVIGFVVFRGAFRDNEFTPVEPVDYVETVRLAQESGLTPIYPPVLPDGWEATSVDLRPGADRTVWSLGMLTDDEQFVGVQQGAGSREDLVELWLDEDATSGGAVELDSGLAPRWQEITDGGGETAYAAQVDGQEVLVHGSAPAEEVRMLLESLTAEPVRGAG